MPVLSSIFVTQVLQNSYVAAVSTSFSWILKDFTYTYAEMLSYFNKLDQPYHISLPSNAHTTLLPSECMQFFLACQCSVARWRFRSPVLIAQSAMPSISCLIFPKRTNYQATLLNVERRLFSNNATDEGVWMK